MISLIMIYLFERILFFSPSFQMLFGDQEICYNNNIIFQSVRIHCNAVFKLIFGEFFWIFYYALKICSRFNNWFKLTLCPSSKYMSNTPSISSLTISILFFMFSLFNLLFSSLFYLVLFPKFSILNWVFAVLFHLFSSPLHSVYYYPVNILMASNIFCLLSLNA